MALPVGYYATEAVRDYVGADYAPFDNQELLYSSILGKDAEIYYPLDLEPEDDDSSIYGSSFVKSGVVTEGSFSGTIEERGQYFAFVDCRAADSIGVAVYKTDGEQQNHWNVTTYEPYVIDLGTLSPEQKVEVTISAENAVSGNIHVVRLDTAALESTVAAIREHGLMVTESSSTSLTGTVTAPVDGALFLSIPYDSGWTATVDGKPAKTFAVDKDDTGEDGAMLAVELPAGEHTVALGYRAPGQIIGLIISIVCAAMIATLWFIERRIARKRIKSAPVIQSAPEEEKEAPAEEDTFTEFLREVAEPSAELPAEAAPSAAPETAPEPTVEPTAEQPSVEEKPTE
jgi:hypothetical protein